MFWEGQDPPLQYQMINYKHKKHPSGGEPGGCLGRGSSQGMLCLSPVYPMAGRTDNRRLSKKKRKIPCLWIFTVVYYKVENNNQGESMKILLCHMWMVIGGAETHVLELARGLAARGHDVTVASNGGVYVEALEAALGELMP